jgi:membrane protease YdiL (CAAX protease family)
LTAAAAAPAAEPAPRRWGLGDVAIGLIPFALIAAVLLAGAGGDGGDGGDDPELTVGGLVANSVILWAFLIGVPLIATRLKGNGPVRDLGLRFRPLDLLGFPLGVLLQAVVVPVLYWPILEVLDRPSDDVSNEAQKLVDSASGAGVLVLVLVVCIGAPFAEELFFRGLFLRAVEKRWTLAAGVVVTTVLFGLTHFQGIQLPALLVFGAVAGVLAARTGRLGAAILCHIGFNAWTVLLLL